MTCLATNQDSLSTKCSVSLLFVQLQLASSAIHLQSKDYIWISCHPQWISKAEQISHMSIFNNKMLVFEAKKCRATLPKKMCGSFFIVLNLWSYCITEVGEYEQLAHKARIQWLQIFYLPQLIKLYIWEREIEETKHLYLQQIIVM